MADDPKTTRDAPALGGPRRQRDPRLWGALLGGDDRCRREAARTILALEAERDYARQLLDTIPTLPPAQRAVAGDSLSLLGDVRFSPPFYLSEMIYVPAGQAILGSSRFPEEYPVHTVDVAGFALAQHPVTLAAFAAFEQATGYRRVRGTTRHPDEAALNAPVVHVSARDAEAYSRWLSAETGHHYRLPTEAEWVLAARGPADRRAYPWGEAYDELCANGWTEGSAQRLCTVGLFPEGRGPYGHDDMAGNVWEWCSSLYWPYPYHANDGREDPGAESEPRVMHGGSWRSRPLSLRCAARQGEPPADSFDVVGFRLARNSSGG